MRQIKFRAWDKKYKQYIVCGYPYGNDAVYSMNPYSGKFQILNASYDYDTGVDIQAKEPDVVLEQFTGLCDKDGKEIYEGDIILNNGSKWVITWSDDAACYMMRHINDQTPGNENIFLWESKNSESIGNIHEVKE